MNIEMKYYWALVVVFLASLGLIVLFHFFPVWPVVSDLAGLSAIGSLFGALFQIARDRIAFDRSVRLEEGRNRFTIGTDRKSTRLNSSHSQISYAVFCLKKKKQASET